MAISLVCTGQRPIESSRITEPSVELHFPSIPSGSLSAASTHTVSLQFTPQSVGQFQAGFAVVSGQQRFELQVQGLGSSVPVFFADAAVDLRMCVFGRSYVGAVVITNSGTSGIRPHPCMQCFSRDLFYIAYDRMKNAVFMHHSDYVGAASAQLSLPAEAAAMMAVAQRNVVIPSQVRCSM